MAAYNQACHDKGCLCATCEYHCSRCLVSDNSCAVGVHECLRYRKEVDSLEELMRKTEGGKLMDSFMSNEEAIDVIEECCFDMNVNDLEHANRTNEALTVAISALKDKSCFNKVQMKTLFTELENEIICNMETSINEENDAHYVKVDLVGEFLERIGNRVIAEMEQNKNGQWLELNHPNYNPGGNVVKCSCCGKGSPMEFPYCPNCGRDMGISAESV